MLSALWGRVTGACTPFLLWVFANMKQVRVHRVYFDSDGMSMTEAFSVLMLPYCLTNCPPAVLGPLLQKCSKVSTSLVLIQAQQKVIHEKLKFFFKFCGLSVGFWSYEKWDQKINKANTLVCRHPVFIMSNSKPKNALDCFVLPPTVLFF